MSVEFKDYYKTLGVDRTATAEEIKKAYRNLARQHHPDKATPANKAMAEGKIKEINEAYEVLKDPKKRRRYDELGREADNAHSGHGSSRTSSGSHGGSSFNLGSDHSDIHFDGTGFSDFFEQLFGGGTHHSGFAGSYRSDRTAGSQRRQNFGRDGHDLEADLMVTLEESAKGATRPISLRVIHPSTGREEVIEFKVRIPVGVKEGQRLRVSGKGGSAEGTGTAGDLFLRVHYAPHPDFRANGSDLYYDLELTPWEAVLGTKVNIPTLDRPVRLTIKPGIQNGQTLRIRGRGLPAGKSHTAGDLFAIISIRIPESITPEERELWEQLAKRAASNPAQS